jgi:8-amino-7-oxononanoate synthase
MLARALAESLRILRAEEWRRAHLSTLIDLLKKGLTPECGRLLPSQTPIQPLVLGSADDAVRRAEALTARGLLVPAIRPPTVPQGTARLRISLSAAHRVEDVQRLLDELRDLAR